MIHFLGYFLKTVEKEPNRVAVVDRDGERTTTYRQLYSCCTRVNAWMRAHGLGRESVSAIYFPKSMEYVATRLGIIMAGGAWVALDDLMDIERRDYVIRDSGCQVVFDQGKWEEAMQMEECPKIADSDLHDLAFILYTSGSTGTPKGVQQEYGLYDYIVECARNFFVPHGEIAFAEVAPQSFLSGPFSSIGMFSVRGALHEISPVMARNPQALTQYFVQHKITDSFLPPTLLTLLQGLINHSNTSLRAVCTGGENASELCSNRFIIANIYSASEFGYPVCLFRVDKPYTNTPVGYPTCGADIVLMNENGQTSEEGEFCIHLPYFRGYLGDEHSCFISLNGKKFFKSSDYVRRDKEGRYIVLSRLDDMVKINGNRVEPAEVENTARRLTGLKNVMVRGFTEGADAFLCLYYINDAAVDERQIREALMGALPYYMVPAHYMRMDNFPRTQSGKLSRLLLPKPETGNRPDTYAAPTSAEERALCDAMAEVLELPRVGAEDDFYALGGSSISSLKVVLRCSLPDLNGTQIYRGRTPRTIAALYLAERLSNGQAPEEERNREAMGRTYRLTEEQRYMFNYHLYNPKSTMLNLAALYRIQDRVDAERFCAAVNGAILSHPALMTVLQFREDGVLEQRYAPELFQPVEIEKLSEQELEAQKDTLVKPFQLIGRPLFLIRIFQTERGVYLFWEFYHLFFDGSSCRVMFRDVWDLYLREEWPAPREPDRYFLMLRERELLRDSPAYAKSREYFERRYGGVQWSTRLSCEQDTRDNRYGEFEMPLDISSAALEELEEQTGLEKNGIFMTIELLAMAALNGKRDVMVAWVYNGRDSKSKENIVGLLLRELPAALSVAPQTSLKATFADIKEQLQSGISHSDYPYIDKNAIVKTNDFFYFIYQEDIYTTLEHSPFAMERVDIDFPDLASESALSVEILDEDGGLVLYLEYSRDRYLEADVQRFVDTMLRLMCGILTFRDRLDTTTLSELFEAASLPFPRA